MIRKNTRIKGLSDKIHTVQGIYYKQNETSGEWEGFIEFAVPFDDNIGYEILRANRVIQLIQEGKAIVL